MHADTLAGDPGHAATLRRVEVLLRGLEERAARGRVEALLRGLEERNAARLDAHLVELEKLATRQYGKLEQALERLQRPALQLPQPRGLQLPAAPAREDSDALAAAAAISPELSGVTPAPLGPSPKGAGGTSGAGSTAPGVTKLPLGTVDDETNEFAASIAKELRAQDEEDTSDAVPVMGTREAFAGLIGWEARQVAGAEAKMQGFEEEGEDLEHGITKRFQMQGLHGVLVAITEHTWFASASGLLIFVNAFFLGLIVHLDTQRAVRGEAPLPWEGGVELVFLALFILELTMRMAAELCAFFVGPHWKWNVFDFVVVASSVFELIGGTFNISFIRTLRVLRMMRVMRAIRLFKFLKELRVMVFSILCCGPPLLWAALLILFAVYLFSVFLEEVARTHLRAVPSDMSDLMAEQINADLAQYYDGVGQSMLYMIIALMGGMDWHDVARPFISIGWMYGIVFIMFVCFVILGMLNVLTGIFVQSASHISDLDQELVIQEEMECKESAMNQLKRLFKELDTDSSGSVTWVELNKCLMEPRVQSYFETLDIPPGQATALFKLLDTDDSGEVGVEEFIVGCLRFKGTAKSIDIAAMMRDQKLIMSKLEDLGGSAQTLIGTVQGLQLGGSTVSKSCNGVSSTTQFDGVGAQLEVMRMDLAQLLRMSSSAPDLSPRSSPRMPLGASEAPELLRVARMASTQAFQTPFGTEALWQQRPDR